MSRKSGFKNLKLGKQVYRQMKRRVYPQPPGPKPQPGPAKPARDADRKRS